MPVSGSAGFRSGFLNTPPRVRLRERDCALGSYPTILRTGDPDFAGKTPSAFDDTHTLIYAGTTGSEPALLLAAGSGDVNLLLRYPSKIPKSHPLFPSGTLATPNVTSSIIINAPSLPAMTDDLINFSSQYVDYLNNPKVLSSTGSESLSPFNESRVYLDRTPFYLTGTSAYVLPGFVEGLQNKTQIVIDTTPATAKSIHFSTGTIADPAPEKVNSGMAYYNFDLKHWEKLGPSYDEKNPAPLVGIGSVVDYLNGQSDIRHIAFRGFISNDLAAASIKFNNTAEQALANSVGGVMSNYGFPYGGQYRATSSHYIKMSNYINHPFLLEKVSIEFSASFGPTWPRGGRFGPFVKSFFLLNQFENTSGSNDAIKPPTIQYLPNSTSGTANPRGSLYSSNPPGYQRDIVTFGSLVLRPSALNAEYGGVWPAAFKRDLDVMTPQWDGDFTGTSTARGPVTGTWTLELPVRTPTRSGGAGRQTFIYKDRPVPGTPMTKDENDLGGERAINNVGGRDGLGSSSGRSACASVVGSRVIAYAPNSFLDTDIDGSVTPVVTGTSYMSPYILLPTDNLILGFENVPATQNAWTVGVPDMTNGVGKTWYAEEALLRSNVVLSPGAGKVTLFGSVLANQSAATPQTNTPLTSDAIHEGIYPGPANVDQFDVEPFLAYSGSYLDEIFTGKFLKGTRVVAGRCTEGTQGTTGSLLRGVKLRDENERYYDSLMPRLQDYFLNSAVVSTAFTPKNNPKIPKPSYYFSGAMRLSANAGAGVARPGDITYWASSASLPFPYDKNPGRVVVDDAMLVVSAGLNDVGFEAISNYDDLKTALFQVGVNQRFTGLFNARLDPANDGNNAQTLVDLKVGGARGFRYGIANTRRMTSKAIFRYNRYGQYRDMLEQRHDTRFYNENVDPNPSTSFNMDVKIMDAPINIIFVDSNNNIINPVETISQNLSKIATSSLPYFDGVAVERPDDPYKKAMITVVPIADIPGAAGIGGGINIT